MIKIIPFYEQYTARWVDTGNEFIANIARMDIPEVYDLWESLSGDEREDMDSYVFFFVDSTEDFESLFTIGAEDFYLVKEN